ncbi:MULTISPECIES: ABC transporter substrate-binding protein [unclassified Oceanispirochaeta]|uniref:ABC transporter substrate-binding protein n=1 Tax=unclassified Oceanispirochaeta TaxID=2635722 RepID=UPI001E5B1D83|nr:MULTISPECIES: extracellular solute-binding protein [unclassified Oceanispirochaeta]
MSKRIIVLMLSVFVLISGVFAAGQQDAAMDEGPKMLVINSNQSDPSTKAAVAETVALFQEEYPEIEVQLNTFDHEAYKTAIRNFLATEAPDVAFWFAGNRMKFFVDQNLFMDVSDVWKDEDLYDSMSSSLNSLTINNKQYGVPWSYYQWGIYYRMDIFEKYGLSVPETWDEFMSNNDVLVANGIAPVTIGTKYLWTAAGWFDYFNLRVNGYEFHMELMTGKASYLDPKLDKVFDLWGDMVKRGHFLENHATYSWQEAQAPLIKGEAAMYLIGNFMMPDMESAGVIDKIGFFQFPIIDPSVGVYEDAPTDTIHIPAKAKNVEAAKMFLAFMTRPDVQDIMNPGSLPPSKYASAPDDRFKKAGFEMLGKADGLAQFYDRDTTPEMAKAGMEGFQEFMVYPDREDAIRTRLERERKSLFE